LQAVSPVGTHRPYDVEKIESGAQQALIQGRYGKTGADLYRAVFKADFQTDVGRYLRPDRELADSESIPAILHPTLVESAGDST